MYLLGHIAIGYTTAWIVATSRKEKLVLWVAFMASVIPDFDTLLVPLGLRHGTYTHSLIILGLAMLALMALSRKTLPYSSAFISHVLADMVVGAVGAFLPLSRMTYSLYANMGSPQDAAIELGALLLMLLIMHRSGDLSRLLTSTRGNLPMLLPIMVVGVSTLRAVSRIFIWRGGEIVGLTTSAVPLIALTIGHAALLVIFTYSFFRSVSLMGKGEKTGGSRHHSPG